MRQFNLFCMVETFTAQNYVIHSPLKLIPAITQHRLKEPQIRMADWTQKSDHVKPLRSPKD